MTTSLNAKLGLDVSDLAGGAMKAGNAIDDLADKLENDLPAAADKGGDQAGRSLVESFSGQASAAIAAGLGGGFVTAFVATVADGMGRLQLGAVLETEFGIVRDRAEDLGREASDLYTSGWGESKDVVVSALGQIEQRLVQTGRVGEEEADRIAEGALIIAQVWGVDVQEVIEATSKLMLNGLAPSATSALDTVAKAMQDGAGAAGDLFESVDEYSQHFAAFGLSAEDMMALFSHGMANGQRDTDKLADAVKEMGILAIVNSDEMSSAYASLGLDADEFRNKILAGGPAAREAFTTIIDRLRLVQDPVERSALAVQFMGTQIEDVGIKALDSFAAMSSGVEGAEGTVDRLNTRLSETGDQTEILKRRLSEGWGAVSEEIATSLNRAFESPQIDNLYGKTTRLKDEMAAVASQRDLVNLLNDAGSAATLSGESIETLTQMLADQGKVLPKLTAAQAQAAVEQGRMADAARYTGIAQRAAADAATQKGAADEKARVAAEAHTEAVEAHTQAVDDLISKNRELVGGELAVEDATFRLADQMAALTTVTAESGEGSDAYARQLNDTKQAVLDQARAAADYEIAQREANGEVVSGRDRSAAYASQLMTLAGTLQPGSALHTAIVGYAAQLSGIPEGVRTSITAPGTSPDGVTRRQIEGHTAAINNIPTSRSTSVTVNFRSTGLQAIMAGIAGGSLKGFADGGNPPANRPVVVGEDGPEIVTFAGGATVHSTSDSRAMLAASRVDPHMAALSARGTTPGPNTQTGTVAASTGVVTPNVDVTVWIGDRQIVDIVDTRVDYRDNQKALIA